MDAEDRAAADDLALLRAHEPVLAYTRGELFLPAAVDRYVTLCSLRGRRVEAPDEELVPVGGLTLDRLATARAEFPGYDLALRLVQQPADRRAVRAARRQAPRVINRSAKLAAVGMLARLVDVLVRLSLVIRGSVPGGVTTEAARLHREHLADGPRPYYGRVVRSHGYIALQYWFFYAMNDWRTTFGGLNDHEADWETLTVYLSATDLRPRWIAVASHDYTGDDLRRRWDDPELRHEGDHPVVFVGAGSHSGAVIPGDYLVRVRPRILTGVVHGLKRAVAWISPWIPTPTTRASASRTWTTHAGTAPGSARAAICPGSRCWSTRRRRGSSGSPGCGAATPATASAASAPRPVPATRATARSARTGPTRSDGPGCTKWPPTRRTCATR